MNAAVAGTGRTPSAWRIERKRFRELIIKWLDYRSNKFFDLSIHGPGYRSLWTLILGILFIGFGFAVHLFLYYYPILAASRQHSLQELLFFAVLTFFQLVFILVIPAQIALTMAGNYLADIFELKNARIAWKFIRELSFAGATEVIHVNDGKIADADKNSPLILIGGPGHVEVEFDSAVLFEKPDGTPHVIGPQPKKPGEEKKKSKADKDITILEGFERLRTPIINLRDQYFGNPSGEPIPVKARSLDGIKISANDVRVVFSIRRNGGRDLQKPTSERPYLYDPQSVEELVYQQAVQVKTDGPHPSGEPGPWTGTLRGLVSGSIAEFMSQNRLAEYLASIGTPEIEESEHREDTILFETLQFSTELPDATSEKIPKPKFHPRTELSERFTKYSDGFSKRAQERGVELHWIGVGTWKIPDEISSKVINGRHLEAWHLSRDNATRSEQSALNAVMDEAFLNEKLRLIQNVPFAAHQSDLGEYTEKEKLVEALLQAYWEQLGDALDVYYKAGVRSEELAQLEDAILIIEKLLNIPGGLHMVGGGSLSKVKRKRASSIDESSPPAPTSHDELVPYRNLLVLMTKLGIDHKAVEPMIENEARRHPTLTRKELIERIVKRLERYGK
jgi:hypothetical protein